MATPSQQQQKQQQQKPPVGGALIAVIGDEDTVTGCLLTGIGQRSSGESNFFIVTPNKTKPEDLERAFREFTSRKDIAIIIITQTVAEEIRYLINAYDQPIPTVLEIPSKESPYDMDKDPVMKRVKAILGRSD